MPAGPGQQNYFFVGRDGIFGTGGQAKNVTKTASRDLKLEIENGMGPGTGGTGTAKYIFVQDGTGQGRTVLKKIKKINGRDLFKTMIGKGLANTYCNWQNRLGTFLDLRNWF